MIRSASCRLNRALGLGAALLALDPLPSAAIDLGSNTQMHGFISQSVIHTSDNLVGGESDDGLAADMRELGLNLSWRPNPDWMLSAQALSRWAGQTDEGELRLDYGFLDRTLVTGEHRFGVQIGKVKNPYGLYNMTRDVAQTRPGVVLPQSIYLDVMRNFALAAPGLSLYGGHDWTNTAISWQLSIMRPDVNDQDLTRFMIGTGKGHFEGKPSWLGQIIWDWDGGRWRTGLTLGHIGMKYYPVPGAGYNPFDQRYLSGQSTLDTAMLSLEKNTEHWTFTLEYSQVATSSKDYSPGNFLLFEQDNTVEAYYVQAQWRFRPGWQAYARYDALYLDKDDRDGTAFSTALPMPSHLRFARDVTLGMRHDIGNWALFAEIHKVDGTAWLSPYDNPGGMSRKWNMLLLEASYRF